MIFVIDIDATIADNSHRVSELEKTCKTCLGPVPPQYRAACPNCGCRESKIKQSTWDKFLMPELVREDTPVAEAQRVIKRFKEMGIEYHFLTGRNDGLRTVTRDWLIEHFGHDPSTEQLIMRPATLKNVTASDYKEMSFLNLQKELGTDKCYAFCEDDEFVFTMYAKYGLVFKCPEAWSSMFPYGESRHNEPAWNL